MLKYQKKTAYIGYTKELAQNLYWVQLWYNKAFPDLDPQDQAITNHHWSIHWQVKVKSQAASQAPRLDKSEAKTTYEQAKTSWLAEKSRTYQANNS